MLEHRPLYEMHFIWLAIFLTRLLLCDRWLLAVAHEDRDIEITYSLSYMQEICSVTKKWIPCFSTECPTLVIVFFLSKKVFLIMGLYCFAV